jgi:hypothetical protein
MYTIEPTKATLWVRYLGSQTIHRAEVFPIPTDQVPVKVKALVKRGDIAEIWYTPGFEFKKDATREYPREA